MDDRLREYLDPDCNNNNQRNIEPPPSPDTLSNPRKPPVNGTKDISDPSKSSGLFRILIYFKRGPNILFVSICLLLIIPITGAGTVMVTKHLINSKNNQPHTKSPEFHRPSEQSPLLNPFSSTSSIDHYLAIDHSDSAIEDARFQALKRRFCNNLIKNIYQEGDRQLFYKFAAIQEIESSIKINSEQLESSEPLCPTSLGTISSNIALGTSLINLLQNLYLQISKENISGIDKFRVITVIIHLEEPGKYLWNSKNAEDMDILIEVLMKLQDKNTHVVIISSENSLVQNFKKSSISYLDNTNICSGLNMNQCVKNAFNMTRKKSRILSIQ